MNFAVYAHAHVHAWNFAAPASYYLCLTTFSKNSARNKPNRKPNLFNIESICLIFRTPYVLKESLGGDTPRANPYPKRFLSENDNAQSISGLSSYSVPIHQTLMLFPSRHKLFGHKLLVRCLFRTSTSSTAKRALFPASSTGHGGFTHPSALILWLRL